jgi:hypothetical protein
MDIEAAFRKLAALHGNHSAAAKALGYCPTHYRRIRNRRRSLPERVRTAIILAAMAPPSDSPTTADPYRQPDTEGLEEV